jgi:hypothetical protein
MTAAEVARGFRVSWVGCLVTEKASFIFSMTCFEGSPVLGSGKLWYWVATAIDSVQTVHHRSRA